MKPEGKKTIAKSFGISFPLHNNSLIFLWDYILTNHNIEGFFSGS